MAVWRDKDGIVNFYVRYPDIHGKMIPKAGKSKKWKTLADGKRAEQEFLDSVKIKDVRFDRLFNLFIENKKTVLKKTTYELYKRQYKDRLIYFSEMYVKDISKMAIAEWQAGLMNDSLSNAYMWSVQRLFKQILQFGVTYEIIDKNPFVIPFVKKKELPKEKETFTLEQFHIFESTLDREDYIVFFNILFFCGLRISEGLGIRYCDYDGKSLRINQQYQKRQKQSLKTLNSYRTIRLDSHTKSLLDEFLKSYVIDDSNSDSLIFGDLAGFSYNNLWRMLRKKCIKNNLPVLSPHGFRHSHATYLLSIGFTYTDVAKRLGDKPETIVKVYGHSYSDSDDRIAEALNK